MTWARARTHKYNARRVVVDGHRFDSAAEARRYGELRLLERAGKISGLRLQPRFELQPSFVAFQDGKRRRAIVYVGDFAYEENNTPVVEDVKGVVTPEFRLKQKMFLYRFPGIKLRVIGGAE